MSLSITNLSETLSKGLEFVEEELRKFKISNKQIAKSLLLVEEALVKLIQNAPENTNVDILITKRLGVVSIKLCANGEPITIDVSKASGMGLDTAGMDVDAEFSIRNMILASFGDKLKINNRNGKNIVKILVQKSDFHQSMIIFSSLILAILVGLLIRFIIPTSITEFINTNIFTPIKNMFISALKTMVGPLIFFSIISSISSFGDMRELGKVGLKVFLFYILTSSIASFMAIVVGTNVSIGEVGNFEGASVIVDASLAKVDFLQTIINIVPSNIVKPFLELDMLQIFFIAILLGIAVSSLGSKKNAIANFFESGDKLFIKAITLIIKFFPVMLFCSVCSLVSSTNIKMIKSLIGLFLLVVALLFVMVCIYCFFLLVFARLNPFTLLKKSLNVILTAFSSSSSNATMPVTMRCCTDKLGISPKIASFSIPLGATINMDGGCISFTMFVTFLAYIYGVKFDFATLLSLFIMVILLTLGSPGIPSSGLVVTASLLVHVGLPIEALGIIVGITPIIDLFTTATNVLGDIVCTSIVAKKHKLIDLEKFNEKA